MATSNQAVSGNLVADHMFMVTAVNASTGMATLHNPWGADGPSGMLMTFDESISSLASDSATFMATTGKSVYG